MHFCPHACCAIWLPFSQVNPALPHEKTPKHPVRAAKPAPHRSSSSPNWNLVWSDEFNGTIGPDWVYDTGGGGWGNNELEYYQQSNASIVNNALAITAKQQSVGGMNYTSARMKTLGKQSWAFGKMEARISMPAFQGIWPAFWMEGTDITQPAGWPTCGEIDIMEHIDTGTSIAGSTHWSSNGSQADFTNSANASSALNNFHYYKVEWTPSLITWFIDGVQYNQFNIAGGAGNTQAFQNQFFFLLNMAVGGNYPGSNVDNSGFPAQMLVDYVRVYQDAGPTNAANSQQPYFMLVSNATGSCADLVGGNSADGAVVNEYGYNYNSANQRWAFLPTEQGNHFRIQAWDTGKCLSVSGNSTADLAQIVDSTYTPGNAAQQWDLVDAGNGFFNIRNVNSGKLLDISGGNSADNTTIDQYHSTGGTNQQWRLQPWGNYYIRALSGRYVCIQNSGSANGSPIIQFDYQANPWFQWQFLSVGAGNYEVSSLNATGRCLCVVNASTSNGANTQLYDYNPNNVGDQKVRILPLTNGKYKFHFVHDGMSWDMNGGQSNNNIPLQQYPDNGNEWQQFELVRIH